MLRPISALVAACRFLFFFLQKFHHYIINIRKSTILK